MEGNHHITSMLESLLAKFDDQKALQDKQLEAQNAFNAQISQDLSNLAKQIDLTQANVDAAHEAVKGAASPSGSVTTVVPPPPPSLQVQAPLQQQLPPSPHTPPDPQRPSTNHARLTDMRPPLIPTPPHIPHQAAAPSPHANQGFGEGCFHKRPKHDFPRFDSSAPYLWLDRCLAYFELYKVAPALGGHRGALHRGPGRALASGFSSNTSRSLVGDVHRRDVGGIWSRGV